MLSDQFIRLATPEMWRTLASAARNKPDRKRVYYAYLKSAAWSEKRAMMFRLSGGKCQCCKVADATQVHHVSYNHLGDEPTSDLRALCGSCHSEEHKPSAMSMQSVAQDVFRTLAETTG